MKSFLITLIKFTFFCFFIYTLLIFLWGTLPIHNVIKSNIVSEQGKLNGYTSTRLKEIKEFENIDILFIGSSVVNYGFDNRIFEKEGYKTFNLGTSGQTPIQTQLLLDRYLDKLNPKLIIYALTPSILTRDGVESSLDIISSEKNDFRSIRMGLQTKHITVYNSLLYFLFVNLFEIDFDWKEASAEGANYIKGGYVESKKDGHYKEYLVKPCQLQFNSAQLNMLKENVSTFQNRKIDYLFVNTPIASLEYNSYINRSDFDSIIVQQGSYLDFNKILNLTDTLHLADATHLNQQGVEIFNSALIELIKEYYFAVP